MVCSRALKEQVQLFSTQMVSSAYIAVTFSSLEYSFKFSDQESKKNS